MGDFLLNFTDTQVRLDFALIWYILWRVKPNLDTHPRQRVVPRLAQVGLGEEPASHFTKEVCQWLQTRLFVPLN